MKGAEAPFYFIERERMEKIQLNDFLSFKYLSGLKVSPDKKRLAFLVAKAHLDKNEYHYDLHVTDGSRPQKLISLKNKGGFIWETEDSFLFVYHKTKAEEKKQKEKFTIYYRYIMSTKKLEKAYEFPFSTTIVDVLDHDKLLLKSFMSSDDHSLYLLNKDDRKNLLDKFKKDEAYEDIKEIPFYFNGQGFIANKRNQLFIYEIASQSIKPIVDTDFNVGQIELSVDKKKIYYTGQQMTGVRSLTTHVFCYDVVKRDTEILYHENDYAINGIHLLGQKVILEATDMKAYGINQNNDFYLLKNKKLELFAPYGQSMGNSVGADVRLGGSTQEVVENENLYFVSTIDDRNHLIELSREGMLRTIFEMDGSIDGIQFLNGQLFMVGLYKQKLQEIYIYNLEHQKLIQLTRFNQKALTNKYVAKPKEFILKQETHDVKGWVLFPKDYNQHLKYPMILDIHGGPKTVYGKVYYHEMQVWANLGYIVIFANPRGSDGKGNDFADIRGKYGSIDYEDLMNFTDLITKRIKSIDTTKLFVTGGSYGGFMTNWIVGHTKRFKAAATQRSISNWLSFHGTSDIGFYFSKDQTGGHPNLDTTKLWNQSPMKYAMEVETPLLFIHSDQDYRCPVEQAMQFYSILKEKGVQTKLVWFKGETHELSRSGKPQARIRRLNEITNWFEYYKNQV
ncbi:MAG: S9 family peptidase [Bacillota bacterium]|nr:MAG: S9 family peptidase [Bacillota bacterium]